MADLSLPGTKVLNGCSMKTILGTGSHVTVKFVGVMQNLKNALPDIAITIMMNPPHLVRVTDGRLLQVMKMICSVRVTLHTSLESVHLIRPRWQSCLVQTMRSSWGAQR